MQRRVRRLLLALVAAGRLAELREAALDVENIIHDLKREPERLAGLADRLDLLGAGRRPAARPRAARPG